MLDDFQRWFERGQDLLAYCPETVLGPTEQRDFDAMLTRSLQELMAARALRGAMSETLALDMQAMAPWHRLVMKVWGLSAALREAGVTLPPDRQKPALFPRRPLETDDTTPGRSPARAPIASGIRCEHRWF
ncbi:DUF2605 family protein [Cyanobium sp. ULC065]